ncbi:MAG: hypothetical protein CBC42_05220 [Betaproteobacteria bacterium TMED82]|mgnify:CR=1 FL=1|nr:MAG: hypothetical protein CBC42_05220 [Betaproteobacteria bacterium TMED82]|tara:strand:- start:105304 stop:106776 length:1473 start_codon:yes stop_codon:yes gene_type:complete
MNSTLNNSSGKTKGSLSKAQLVFVSGNFNLVHSGHLRLLNFAKSFGEKLIIGLFEDDTPGVFVNFKDRESGLVSLEAVDEVIKISKHELKNTLLHLQPAYVVKGREFKNIDNPEKRVLDSFGGKLIFSSGEAKFSTRSLIRREFLEPNKYSLEHDYKFLNQNEISLKALRGVVSKFSDLRVLVIGDLIIDEYVYCEPLGMSQEDPTIVVSPIDTKTFIGGAGIVSAHLVGLGAEAKFLSVVGRDDTADYAEKSLRNYGVVPTFIVDESRPTIKKQRFRADQKTMLRVSHLRSHDVADEKVNEMLHKFISIIDTVDLVIFSDFNYGCLPDRFIKQAMETCIHKNIRFYADSQASSQIGDISRYSQADLLSATEREVRLAVNDFKFGLQNVSNILLEKSKSKNLIVKLGAEGLIVLTSSPRFKTFSLPAMNYNPVDVAGAGDALLATAVLSRGAGASISESSYLGAVGAGLQVSRIGNIPLLQDELLRRLMD